MESIKQQIEQLRAELHEHNYNYYVLSRPVISDFEFDRRNEATDGIGGGTPGI